MAGSLPAAGARGRTRRLLAVALAVLASTAVLAACGDDDDDSPGPAASGGGQTSTPAADKPTGEPIKAMSIAAVNWNGPQYPNILETAKLYEQYINDRGGIKGRPLQVTTCDEMGDPNQLATCGRRAISEGVVAVVGSFTLTGDRIVPLLEDAKTAWFGVCCVISPAEANSPITFNFGPGVAATPASAIKAAELGCKKPALVLLDYAGKNVTIQGQTRVLKSRGIDVAKTVIVPIAAQDYAPQVAQATGGGVDCILGNLSESQWASFMPAFAQSGSDAKLIGYQGNFDEKVTKNFAEIVKDDIVIGFYPDISDPAFKDYREAIEQYDPPSDLDYNSLGGLGTWTAYTGFKAIIEGMSGPITNETFLKAANETTALETGGKIPVLDLTKPWTDAPFGYTRIFNTSVTFLKYGDNAKLEVDTPGFQDMKEAAIISGGEQ